MCFPNSGKPWIAGWRSFTSRERLIPHKRVLDTIAFQWNLDDSPEDIQAWQTYVEAGSLVRWIVESRGCEVFWHFHQSRSARAALGTPIADVEREWLGHLGRPGQTPMPCRDVLAQHAPRF